MRGCGLCWRCMAWRRKWQGHVVPLAVLFRSKAASTPGSSQRQAVFLAAQDCWHMSWRRGSPRLAWKGVPRWPECMAEQKWVVESATGTYPEAAGADEWPQFLVEVSWRRGPGKWVTGRWDAQQCSRTDCNSISSSTGVVWVSVKGRGLSCPRLRRPDRSDPSSAGLAGERCTDEDETVQRYPPVGHPPRYSASKAHDC